MNTLLNTITIPANLVKEKDLVIVPRREYDRFLKWLGKSSDKEKAMWQEEGEEELMKSYSNSDSVYDQI